MSNKNSQSSNRNEEWVKALINNFDVEENNIEMLHKVLESKLKTCMNNSDIDTANSHKIIINAINDKNI